jgi:hypothetical protein
MIEEAKPAAPLQPIKRPFYVPRISVAGKYLHHEDIMKVVRHFADYHIAHLQQELRDNMGLLSAHGSEFTAEQWAATFEKIKDE